jgi:glutamate carboxypeptidase
MLKISDFQPYTPDMLELLTRLVEIESPSTSKQAVDRLGALLQGELSGMGAEVTVSPQAKTGDHIVASWNRGLGSGILLLCHMDTVFAAGTLNERPVRVQDGRFYGPGALDMKSGIVIAIHALRRLQESGGMPRRAITLLLTSDEEIGSNSSRALIEQLAARASLVLCLEPAMADGALKTFRKGTGSIKISTQGRAAHAGVDHEKGVNAIEELAHHVLAAQRLTDYARGTTVSVGKVSGGTRSNVIPDKATAITDLRISDPAEVERLQEWARSRTPVLSGAQVTVTVSTNRPPMPRDARMLETFQKIYAIGEQLGLQLSEGGTGGASDANFVAPLGVAVMDGLGAVGEGAHSEREVLKIESLPERAALLAAILAVW